MKDMSVHKAVVRQGRLQLDEPTDLPENAQVPLFDANPYEHIESFDGLDDAARGALEATLDRGWEDLEAGRGLSLDEALNKMSAR